MHIWKHNQRSKLFQFKHSLLNGTKRNATYKIELEHTKPFAVLHSRQTDSQIKWIEWFSFLPKQIVKSINNI